MSRFSRTFLLVLLFAAVAAFAAGLPDTGQDTCYNDTVADGVLASSLDSIARDKGSHPRQDCRYGRDAAAIAGMLPKTGAGAKGFDYTKIANNGNTLPASAALGTANTAWACTRDNITGLTWEVKTATSTDLRYSGHTYSWYSTDAGTNEHQGTRIHRRNLRFRSAYQPDPVSGHEEPVLLVRFDLCAQPGVRVGRW